MRCASGNGVHGGSFVRCGVPAERSVKGVHISFRYDCRGDNPFNTGSVNRLMVSAPYPTLTRTVCGTANIHLARLPVAPRGVTVRVLGGHRSVQSKAGIRR